MNTALTDRLGQPITVGCKVIIAQTAKSAGISWKIATVSRVSDKRFFYATTNQKLNYEVIGKPSNALVIDKLTPPSNSGVSTREIMSRELGHSV